MSKRWNALDWYHEIWCRDCDRQVEDCPEGSHKEIACLLAAILHELTAKATANERES